MKKSNLLFAFFLLLILLFSYFQVNLLYFVTTQDVVTENPLLKLTSLLIASLGLYLILEHFTKIRLKGIHLICLLWYLFMPFCLFLNKGKWYDFISTILWPLLFQISFILTSQNSLRVKKTAQLFFVIFVINLFFLYRGINSSDQQSNIIFFVLLTLPWLLSLEKKSVRLLLLLIVSFAVLLSLKRSSILIIVFIWTIYGCLAIKNSKGKTIALCLIAIFLLAGVFAFEAIDELTGGRITERLNKEETDEGRGRLAIYEVTMNMQQNSSTLSWLFGHGHSAVKKDSPLDISAHNDFLEVLYDYGLIIMILYICLWGYVLKRAIYLYKINSFYLFPYLASIGIFIVMSSVSHLILYASYFNFLVIFWGCIEGLITTDRKYQLNLLKSKRSL